MMADRLDQYFGVHGTALRLRSERMGVIASNIANAATPGYKARDLDFTSAFASSGSELAMARTSSAHLQASETEGEARLAYRQPVQPSLDGNTVELATEQVQFAETALRYRGTLGMLNGRIQSLTSALKGEQS
ncbi:flagellar basal body rod protein FlgB [Sandaracinobacter neustonicus]|uniref:Flagellar basal body rod protein FlgB n=1 Tax=Sandaracinobacter neustonicus TaxID=1715348 RepID=A0A501XFD5_9SPHN|nr:flagellar basal body rod protein FlgB [Sandaracinobacter neustonicus]TPE59014.1 flagellar basal body rod protein FlgB [Sandaracinobacter neustonicus]